MLTDKRFSLDPTAGIQEFMAELAIPVKTPYELLCLSSPLLWSTSKTMTGCLLGGIPESRANYYRQELRRVKMHQDISRHMFAELNAEATKKFLS